MFKIILAFRYLMKRRITYLAVFAVALCVFMVVVVMTVMTGLARDFKDKNHSWVGDCVISSQSLVGFGYYEEFIEILEKTDFVQAVSPVINSYGILTRRESGYNDNIEIMGIEPLRYSAVTGFSQTLYYNKDDVSKAFTPSYDPNLPGCVAGIDIVLWRDQRGQYERPAQIPTDSFEISCFPLTPKGALAKADLGLVNTKTFYYSDDSHSGLPKVDGGFIYLPFDQAQMLCGMNGPAKRVSALHLKFAHGVKLQAGCEKAACLWADFVDKKIGQKGAELLSKVKVESWKSNRRDVIAGIEKEQIMMIATFGLIGIITVFIVFVIFYMIVSHKSKDIGILKSIGVSNGNIIKLFLFFGLLTGILGSLIGTMGGVVFLNKINQIENWLYERYEFQLWNRMVYAIDDIPNRLEFDTLAIIIVSAIAACLIGAFVPSWKASRLKPIETLQVTQL